MNEKSDAQSGNTSTRPYKKASIRTTTNHSRTLLNPDDATTPVFHHSVTEAHSTVMPQNKANILLRQFKSAFTLDSEPPPSQPRPQVPSCQKITINTDGVAKLLKSLQVHKAPGPDGIPNTVLQTCADSIAPTLTMIFQRSLDTGRLPKDWLSAISSAYKKGDRHLAENYRPISLVLHQCHARSSSISYAGTFSIT